MLNFKGLTTLFAILMTLTIAVPAEDNNLTGSNLYTIKKDSEGNAQGVRINTSNPDLTIAIDGSATEPTRSQPEGEVRGTVGVEISHDWFGGE